MLNTVVLSHGISCYVMFCLVMTCHVLHTYVTDFSITLCHILMSLLVLDFFFHAHLSFKSNIVQCNVVLCVSSCSVVLRI